MTFEDVIIRVSDAFNFRMHIDFDEANAASVKGFT
ncbi:MAG: PduL/EutD family phosphate acyltransferase, partial [Blautia sp.]